MAPREPEFGVEFWDEPRISGPNSGVEFFGPVFSNQKSPLKNSPSCKLPSSYSKQSALEMAAFGCQACGKILQGHRGVEEQEHDRGVNIKYPCQEQEAHDPRPKTQAPGRKPFNKVSKSIMCLPSRGLEK